jgi:hypothetical protein
LTPILVSKVFTGEFLSSSISRIPLGGNEDIFFKIISAIKNLLRAPIYFANFTVPHNGFDVLSDFIPKSLKFLSLAIFVYFTYLAVLKSLEIYKTNSFSALQKNEFLNGKYIVFMYLVILLLVSSITGTGLGEFNRYFVFMFVLALSLILNFKLLRTGPLTLLLAINVTMLPAVFLELGSSISFNKQVLSPVAKKIGDITGPKDIVMLDSAGLISIYVKGKVVDVYGLGTKRYSKVHGDFPQVYRLIEIDRPNYIVAWEMDKPTYYLDSAHYEVALEDAEFLPIFSRQDSYFGRSYYPEMTIYKVVYR